MKSKVFVFLLFVFVAATMAAPFRNVETLGLRMSGDSTAKAILAWSKRMNASNVDLIQSVDSSGRPGKVVLGDIDFLYASSKIKIESVSADSSRLNFELKSAWPDEFQKNFYPKISSTLQQELGVGGDSGSYLKKKSLGVYLLLSTVNTAFGGFYLKHENFIYRPNSFLIAANGIGDAYSVALMFSKDRTHNILGYWMFGFYRVLALLPISSLNLHNKFTSTGYRYEF